MKPIYPLIEESALLQKQQFRSANKKIRFFFPFIPLCLVALHCLMGPCQGVERQKMLPDKFQNHKPYSNQRTLSATPSTAACPVADLEGAVNMWPQTDDSNLPDFHNLVTLNVFSNIWHMIDGVFSNSATWTVLCIFILSVCFFSRFDGWIFASKKIISTSSSPAKSCKSWLQKNMGYTLGLPPLKPQDSSDKWRFRVEIPY